MDVDFKKSNGLVPAIVQDARSGKVLMLGFMNEEALKTTLEIKRVTFFSRSKNRLWTKGESSGNYLELVELLVDCDKDTILVKATPAGPVCHTGKDTCFGEENMETFGFLSELEKIIQVRKTAPREDSYTSKLLAGGIERISQKVGEEAVETVIAALRDDKLVSEAADLVFHLLVLLVEKNITLKDLEIELKTRHQRR